MQDERNQRQVQLTPPKIKNRKPRVPGRLLCIFIACFIPSGIEMCRMEAATCVEGFQFALWSGFLSNVGKRLNENESIVWRLEENEAAVQAKGV